MSVDTNLKNLVLNELTEAKLAELESMSAIPANELFLTEDTASILTASMPLGSIFSSLIEIDDIKVHKLDGATLSQDDYKEFVEYLRSASSNNKTVLYNNEEFEADMTTYGQCGHFVINDTDSTFRLPCITKFIQGTTDITTLGKAQGAGLPNITGGLDFSSTVGFPSSSNNEAGSAITRRLESRDAYISSQSSTANRTAGINFDASRSNDIYGKSTTVQPEAIQCFYYIVLANAIPNDLAIAQTPSGASGDIIVDSILSSTSTNPVQNKVVTKAINDLSSTLEEGDNNTRESVLNEVKLNYVPINTGTTQFLFDENSDYWIATTAEASLGIMHLTETDERTTNTATAFSQTQIISMVADTGITEGYAKYTYQILDPAKIQLQIFEGDVNNSLTLDVNGLTYNDKKVLVEDDVKQVEAGDYLSLTDNKMSLNKADLITALSDEAEIKFAKNNIVLQNMGTADAGANQMGILYNGNAMLFMNGKDSDGEHMGLYLKSLTTGLELKDGKVNILSPEGFLLNGEAFTGGSDIEDMLTNKVNILRKEGTEEEPEYYKVINASEHLSLGFLASNSDQLLTATKNIRVVGIANNVSIMAADDMESSTPKVGSINVDYGVVDITTMNGDASIVANNGSVTVGSVGSNVKVVTDSGNFTWNDNIVATQIWVTDTLLGEGAHEDLNTISELSAALQNNKDIITTLNQAIADKANTTALEALEDRVETLESGGGAGGGGSVTVETATNEDIDALFV